MFEAYVKERQNADCMKYENGFLFYRIQGEEFYIVDLFIEKSHRKSGLLETIISDASAKAIDNKCKFLSGNIYLNDTGCNRTMAAALKVGFKIMRAENNILLIVKEL